jgi:hypothetical protein
VHRYHHRFATLRIYDVGAESALARFNSFKDALTGAGHAIATTLREYAVYDSNVELDRGWLDRLDRVEGVAAAAERTRSGRTRSGVVSIPAECGEGDGDDDDHADDDGADGGGGGGGNGGDDGGHSARAHSDRVGGIDVLGHDSLRALQLSLDVRCAEGSDSLAGLIRAALWGRTHLATRLDVTALFMALKRELAKGMVQLEWSAPAGVGE